ncbi:MAG TPA: prenyltransferase/squalene oxidase repeat-containing protein [Candidatus Angelobacter sp.]|nr:prenyltransferase/squalene oxidase repeat-containing protein [Candidatus Angelobacter sp.]
MMASEGLKFGGDYTEAGVLPASALRAGISRRTNGQAISAGLDFVFSAQRGGCWSDFHQEHGKSDVWVTAYVLARLGEMPAYFLSDAMRLQVRMALDWLTSSQVPGSGWGYDSGAEADAETTAWVIMALRRHGCPVPEEALAFLERCVCEDGGTAFTPDSFRAGVCWNLRTAEVTALAANALQNLAPSTTEYLKSWLLENKRPDSCGSLTSPLAVCSAILDLGRNTAPRTLSDRLREVLVCYSTEEAFDCALLLRSLLALRLQRAWWVAVSLRRMQQADGSWPASARSNAVFSEAHGSSGPAGDQKRIVTTITAVASLVMAEAQPGLYFGSDLPLPRRLYES